MTQEERELWHAFAYAWNHKKLYRWSPLWGVGDDDHPDLITNDEILDSIVRFVVHNTGNPAGGFRFRYNKQWIGMNPYAYLEEQTRRRIKTTEANMGRGSSAKWNGTLIMRALNEQRALLDYYVQLMEEDSNRWHTLYQRVNP